MSIKKWLMTTVSVAITTASFAILVVRDEWVSMTPNDLRAKILAGEIRPHARDAKDFTPLHWAAAKNNNPEVIKLGAVPDN